MMDEDELDTVLSEQRRELLAAKTIDADLEVAFELQMQEALRASLALQPSASVFPPHLTLEDFDFSQGKDNEAFDYTSLMLDDIDRYAQEFKDRELSEAEMRKVKEDIDRRIHDQKFASYISSVPEDEWKRYGDVYDNPYGKGASSSSGGLMQNECFRLYCKGLVSDERIRDLTVRLAGIGVAICDSKDNPIFQVGKPLPGGEMITTEAAGLEAITDGLNGALNLDMKRVLVLCDDDAIVQYVIGSQQPGSSRAAELVSQLHLLSKKFTCCNFSHVEQNEINIGFKLAREAIVSQINWSAESRRGKCVMETCSICFEDTNANKMFSIDGCLHRYCFSCMKQHVEAKLLNGMVAKCPNQGCKSEVKIESCKQIMEPRLVELMAQRMKEASVAATEKVYCPYPKCSALMSKSEVLEYTNKVNIGAQQTGARRCIKCQYYFCVNCKAPWHYNMTCKEFIQSNPGTNADDAKLKSLAKQKLWRQCVKCNHVIELAFGCYHITCRCGYEFCYTCGAEWKNKQATCKCRIWDERNIIRNTQVQR